MAKEERVNWMVKQFNQIITIGYEKRLSGVKKSYIINLSCHINSAVLRQSVYNNISKLWMTGGRKGLASTLCGYHTHKLVHSINQLSHKYKLQQPNHSTQSEFPHIRVFCDIKSKN